MTAAEILQRRNWLAYLAQRKGTYEYRCLRYAAVYEILLILGLQPGDLIVDVGAGMCDFDRYIRSVRGFDGRYLPIDGAIQGFDLNTWRPDLRADFYICLETLEHLTDPLLLAWKLRIQVKLADLADNSSDLEEHLSPVEAQSKRRRYTAAEVTLYQALEALT